MTKKFIPTQEALDDLSKMSYEDFCNKYRVSRRIPNKLRKEYNIVPMQGAGGKRLHRFENGVEVKYCSKGHWTDIVNFRKVKGRKDGLHPHCHVHEIELKRKRYREGSGKEKAQKWRATEGGKKSLRNTWRKQKAIKDNAYVLWEHEHEENVYNMFDGACAYCGIKIPFLKIEFDHFVPIKGGGKTEPGNMLPCCSKCNHGTGGKFTRDAWEWLQEKFGLSRAGYIWSEGTEKLKQLSIKAQG